MAWACDPITNTSGTSQLEGTSFLTTWSHIVTRQEAQLDPAKPKVSFDLEDGPPPPH